MAQRLGGYAIVLLVVAGQFKSHPALSWLPFDLTLVAGGIVAIAMVISVFGLGAPSRFTILPVILWLLLLPTVATAMPSPYGQTKVFTLFTITFLLALSPFFLLRTPTQRRSFLHALVVAGAIASIDVLAGGSSVELYGRVSAEGTDTIGTARLAMAGAVALAVIAMSRESRVRVRLFSLFGALSLAVIALMTGSRGPALAAALSILVAVALAPMFNKYRVRALAAVAALGTVAVFVVARDGNVGFARILTFVSGDTDRSSLARTQMWEAAWEGILRVENGQGWGSFAEIGGPNPYPHNLLLEVGFEAGFIAMVAVAVLLLAGAISALRRATDGTGVAFFALLVFSAFNAMVSSDINGSRLLVVVLFAAWAVNDSRARGAEHLPAPKRAAALRTNTRTTRVSSDVA
ncbi:hypothetical protein CQ034_18470 [Microbacterium sp. MYb45]|nr:hypothetical protein CQ034_18470 [Microbacterium sp. MYb45]